jgi:hypothetical protein
MNTYRLAFLIFVTTIACHKTISPTGPDDRFDTPTCTISVDRTSPSHGSMGHYYRDPIRFELSAPDPTASFVTDMVGTTSVSEDGLTLTFMPDGTLSPSTEYTVALDYCFGAPEITFTTSHYGAPLSPSVDLEYRTYTLDLNAGDYTIGNDIGELFSAVFKREILFELQDIDGTEVEVLAAVSAVGTTETEQDMCARTIFMDEVDIGGMPFFYGSVADYEFGALEGVVRFAQFDFYGTIASDGESIGGLGYVAAMGVEEIAEMLPDFGDVDDLCVLAENLGVPCEPCPGDADRTCMTIAAEHIQAAQVDVELEVIPEVRSHPDCESE